jgi:hypothetical protein
VKEEVIDNAEKTIREQGLCGYNDALLKRRHVVEVN